MDFRLIRICFLRPAGYDLPRYLPADRGDFALQVPNASLASVSSDDIQDRPVGEQDVLFRQPIGFDFFLHEKPFRDVELLGLCVPGNPDDLHAVLERRRDGLQDVGRRDEHHVGQVVVHFQVIVAEGAVLLRIEDFEQGRTGVSPEVGAELVDLVEAQHGVVGPRLFDELDDLAGKRPDVGTAMSADFRLIAQAAQREPYELSVRCPGNRLGDGGLADAGRSHQTEDGTLVLFHEGLHGQVLEDPLLDLFEPVMILFENGLGFLHGMLVFRLLAPGHVEEPVDVVPHDGCFRRHGGHHLELLDLVLDLLLRLLRELFTLQALLEIFDLARKIVLIAHLLLDGTHLLVEVVVLLGLLHLLLDTALDFLFQLEDLDLADDQGVELLEASLRRL